MNKPLDLDWLKLAENSEVIYKLDEDSKKSLIEYLTNHQEVSFRLKAKELPSSEDVKTANVLVLNVVSAASSSKSIGFENDLEYPPCPYNC